MLNLLGEYDCKLDSKGRFLLPSKLKKQIIKIIDKGFIINRDIFEKCLVIYPMQEWEKIIKQLNKLNRFVQKNELFRRKFNNGATAIEIDGNGRLLIPKHLIDYAGLKREIKLFGNGDRIEVWSKEKYEEMLNYPLDMGALAEEVMGNIKTDNPDELP